MWLKLRTEAAEWWIIARSKKLSHRGFGECSVVDLLVCLNPFSYGCKGSGRQNRQLQIILYRNTSAQERRTHGMTPCNC